jgi:hypothetical protein
MRSVVFGLFSGKQPENGFCLRAQGPNFFLKPVKATQVSFNKKDSQWLPFLWGKLYV